MSGTLHSIVVSEMDTILCRYTIYEQDCSIIFCVFVTLVRNKILILQKYRNNYSIDLYATYKVVRIWPVFCVMGDETSLHKPDLYVNFNTLLD